MRPLHYVTFGLCVCYCFGCCFVFVTELKYYLARWGEGVWVEMGGVWGDGERVVFSHRSYFLWGVGGELTSTHDYIHWSP